MKRESGVFMGKLIVGVLGIISSFGLARGQEGWEVSGTVTADSRPLKGMYVIVLGPSSISSAVTDSRGSYSVKGVAPGRYTIAVQKKENTSAPEPRTLSLAGGMHVRVDFRIAKGSVISGRVLDRDGQPVPGLVVQAFLKTVVDRRLRMNVRGATRQTIWGNTESRFSLKEYTPSPRRLIR